MPGLRIYNNVYSLNAQNSLSRNTQNMGSSLEKLSTGLRVNKASDDAAALMISTSLRADISSMNQAIRNTSDSMSLLNVAEGAISTSQQMLVRMRELAMESSTATVGSSQRASINQEFTALKTEITRISNTTEFNGQKLLNGELASGATVELNVQVGIQNTSDSRINLNQTANLGAMDSGALGLSTAGTTVNGVTTVDETTGSNITTAANALAALDTIDTAIDTVTAARGNIGAVQNRLSMSISNLETTVENTTAADSNLRDADMAKEISKFTRDQILVQASTSMLSQANLIPQSVLQLLQ